MELVVAAIAVRAAFCAICIDGTDRLRPRQMDEGGPVFVVCAGCDSEPPEPAILAKPPGRKYAMHESALDILRAVHRLEWASSIDIREALGIPGAVDDRKRLDKFSQMLSRLSRGGYLRSRQRDFREYQLTEPGALAIGVTL